MRKMWKIKKWLEHKTVPKKEYDDEKREFEMAIGKPFITLKIELPKGFEDQRTAFLNLENNAEFLEEVEDLAKKNLIFQKRQASSEQK